MADVELVIKIPEEVYEKFGREYREEGAISKRTNDVILDAFCNATPLSKEHGRAFTNSEWIDFLSKQFDVSRASAKDMLHVMMSVKREDNFKKQFSGAKLKDPEAPATEAAEMEDEER